MSIQNPEVTTAVMHATLVFERTIQAPLASVFAALAQVELRMQWGAPSEAAALIYDSAQFQEGCEDRFRCGPKSNPNIHGATRYLEIIENQRIVSTETITVDGKRLCFALNTLELSTRNEQTALKSTHQIASFIGQDMIKGVEMGNNASLDNLVKFLNESEARKG